MTNKQMMALLYAIDTYLTNADEKSLNAAGSGEYFRGVRDGVCDVIGDITKIMRQYSFDPNKFGNGRADKTRNPCGNAICRHVFDDIYCEICELNERAERNEADI